MAPERSRRRVVLSCVAALVGVWLVACCWMLFSARNDAEEGLDSMDGLGSLSTKNIGTFLDAVGGQDPQSSLQDDLRNSSNSFDSAHGYLSSPILVPLRYTPVIGRQIRSLDALTAAATTVTGASADTVGSLGAILDSSGDSTKDRLATTTQVQAVLTEFQSQVNDLDLGPSKALIGPVSDARERFVDEYQHVTTSLDTAVVAVTGVNEFLQGPNKYLVLAANNAEMRAGSGMFLQIGTMDVENGAFSLGGFEATAMLKLPQPGATLDPDLESIWGPLQPTQDWRNINVTPRFDESSRLASQMWTSLGREPVDGVMAIDVIGLKRLLRVVGPVQVDGPDGPLTIDADNVRSQLLLKQYVDGEDEATAVRRALLGTVAGAVFQSFNERPVSASQLLSVLQDAGAGRHLLMWSDSQAQQAAWEALGAAGSLSDNDLMVAVLNRGGNKLDQFVTTSSVLSSTTTGTSRRMSVQVTLSNVTPEGLPRYVAGPYAGTDLAEGEYLGLLSLTVPEGAGNPSVDGADLVAAGKDGPTKVIISNLRIPRGQTLVVTVEFDLPVAWTSIEVLPSARVPPMEWTAGDQRWTERRPKLIQLDTLS